MNRYFPEVVEQVLALPGRALVLDGEMIIVVDGVQEFDLLSQRIHPAASRVEMLREETPAAFVAFDLLADGGRGRCSSCPTTERRERLEEVVADPVELTPMTADPEARRPVADRQLRGRGRQAGRGRLPARRAHRDGEDQARAHRRLRGGRVPLRQGGGHRRLADPRHVRRRGRAARGGPHLGLHGPSRSASCSSCSSPTAPASAASGEPSRWKSDEELVWEGLRPELVCEIAFDHITGNRIRHGAKFLRWRDDKRPEECEISQLRELASVSCSRCGASPGLLAAHCLALPAPSAAGAATSPTSATSASPSTWPRRPATTRG